MTEPSAARVAVYLDFDNIVISRYDQVNGRNSFQRDKAKGLEASHLARARVDVGAVLDFASSFGTVVLTRAYADWSAGVNAEYREQLVGRAVDLVQLFPAAAYGKNGADIRLAVDAVESIADFGPAEQVLVPEIGLHSRFERPVLHARLRTRQGQPLHVLVAHLKSKRPKYLQDAHGALLEDRDDPAVTARATLRSLLMRAAEAAALRRVVVGITSRHGSYGTSGGEPLVLLGDLPGQRVRGEQVRILYEQLPYSITGTTIAGVFLAALMWDLASRNVELLSRVVTADAPLVGIEPSAILSFRDEYPDLVPERLAAAARNLAGHALLIDEFLAREAARGRISADAFIADRRDIKLHGHCHQKALSSLAPTVAALSLPRNYSVEVIPSGCCGMAGSFGYEREHFELSMQIGELVLLPAVRAAGPEVLLAAPGTSCRHQIKDGTGREASHPVEILHAALVATS